MISICIPTYNCNVEPLIENLLKQAERCDEKIEIIVIDDASNEKYLIKNAKIIEKIKYIVLPQNIGRAKIRNRFLDYASYNYLLFLDSDTMPVSDKFIFNYIDTIKNNPQIEVLCGGHVYLDSKPERRYFLRWYYGMKRECKSAQIRNINPYKSFITMNFLINKKVLSNIKFEEKLGKYGHEDTLFGYMIKQNNIPILHIENPVFHFSNIANEKFILNTLEGINNLFIIQDIIEYKKDFIHFVRLLDIAFKIEKLHLKRLIIIIYFFSAPLIKFLLNRGFPSLFLFDFLKLGYTLKVKQ